MRVRDIMTLDPACCIPETPVCDVATMMVDTPDMSVEDCAALVGREELGRVVRAARWTRGVRMVDDQLTARDEAAGG